MFGLQLVFDLLDCVELADDRLVDVAVEVLDFQVELFHALGSLDLAGRTWVVADCLG